MDEYCMVGVTLLMQTHSHTHTLTHVWQCLSLCLCLVVTSYNMSGGSSSSNQNDNKSSNFLLLPLQMKESFKLLKQSRTSSATANHSQLNYNSAPEFGEQEEEMEMIWQSGEDSYDDDLRWVRKLLWPRLFVCAM